MGLIKRQFAEPAMKSAIVLDLGDIAKQAAQIREAAERDAERIVAEAREKSDALSAQAHSDASEQGQAEGYAAGMEKGKKEGYEAALKEMRKRLGSVDKAWGDAIEGWEAHREQLGREAHHAVVRLGLRLGEKIVRRAIHVDRGVAVRQVGDALAYVLRPVDVTVRICGEDREVLEDALPELMGRMGHLGHVHLRDDESVTRGGCVISYGQGQIDATVETQLDRMVRTLLPESVVSESEGEGTASENGGDEDVVGDVDAGLSVDEEGDEKSGGGQVENDDVPS